MEVMLISVETEEEYTRQVNEKLAEGWELSGDVQVFVNGISNVSRLVQRLTLSFDDAR